MTEFESCDLVNAVWAFGDGAILRLWVFRLSDVPKFQLLAITLFSAEELEVLREAVNSIVAPPQGGTHNTVAENTAWQETAYETDYAAAGKWATASNDHLIMKVKRSTPQGTQSELNIAIRTSVALRYLDEATQKIKI